MGGWHWWMPARDFYICSEEIRRMIHLKNADVLDSCTCCILTTRTAKSPARLATLDQHVNVTKVALAGRR
jgi:hypothetical protein